MKKILGALQDLLANQHSQSGHSEIRLVWQSQLAGRFQRAPRISSWLCIINGMSKMASSLCSNFSHLFLMVQAVCLQSKCTFQYFLGYTHPVFDYPLIDSIYQSTTNSSDASFAVDGKPDTCAFTNEDNLGQAHHMFSRFLNLHFFFTKFSLFCFSTRQKPSQGRHQDLNLAKQNFEIPGLRPGSPKFFAKSKIWPQRPRK